MTRSRKQISNGQKRANPSEGAKKNKSDYQKAKKQKTRDEKHSAAADDGGMPDDPEVQSPGEGGKVSPTPLPVLVDPWGGFEALMGIDPGSTPEIREPTEEMRRVEQLAHRAKAARTETQWKRRPKQEEMYQAVREALSPPGTIMTTQEISDMLPDKDNETPDTKIRTVRSILSLNDDFIVTSTTRRLDANKKRVSTTYWALQPQPTTSD
ncbi:hypothetical protein IQ06DRAFT_375223 [Phaeosphaeriaceae sp. SRC1lsM3a]|nr:hypothetical protein IQ06DRAFT_375223 [Stagonospora sp. SRC1lsM3a]